jgi:hypothetical protein
MSIHDQRLEKLADLLEKQVLDASLTDGRMWQELAVSERTFYRLKPKALQILQKRTTQRQQAIEHTKTHEIKQAVKQGLKSKNERVLLLQKQVDDIQSELDADTTFEYIVVQGRIQKVVRPLTPTEKAHLRRSIKYIQSEISKIEGDYAPKKVLNIEPDTVLVPGEDDE